MGSKDNAATVRFKFSLCLAPSIQGREFGYDKSVNAHRILAALLAGLCFYSQGHACSWDYPIWPKSKKSDTPLFRFVVNQDKAGYIDQEGKIAIPPRFWASGNGGGDFFNGLAQVLTKADGYFLIDARGNRVQGGSAEFSEGLATKSVNGKVGFRDRAGRLVIPAEFDTALEFSEGVAAVKIRGLYGYIDPTGKFVIPPQFGRAESFHDGRAVVIENGPCTWIGDGPCAAFNATAVPAHGGPLGRTGPWGECMYSVIDHAGKVIISGKYPDMAEFSEGLAPAGNGNKWGYIDTTGRIRIGLQFEGVGSFSEGLARVRWGGRTGFIDRTGMVVMRPQYAGAYDFSEGLAMVFDESGRASFIDKKGKQAFPGEFDAATSFVMGLAHVRHGKDWASSEWSYIDKTGKTVFRYRENSGYIFQR